MQILSNNVAILEDDEALSRYVREAGSLILDTDIALRENLRWIKDGDWVVDGGAAIGDHTAAYLKKVGQSGRVFAFEPNPRYVECLRYNCPTAEICDCGLSDITGDTRMHVGIGGNMGAGHITPSGEVPIRTMRLDDLLLGRLDFLKLDVEGYELKAMLGAIATINTHRPIIQLEWNPGAMANVGINPQDVLRFIGSISYAVEFFMGNVDVGGELIAHPK